MRPQIPFDKICIKVSVSTLLQEIQIQADVPLPMRGNPLFFSEKAEVKTANTVVAMRFLKARVTLQNVINMDNSIHKGTPIAKIFNNGSVSEGW